MNRAARRRAQKARGNTVFHSCHPNDIARAIVVCEAAGQIGHAELFKELRRGGFDLVAGFGRRDPVSTLDLESSRHPVLIVISDDDYGATGPTGWRSAEVITSWARAALIHAAKADRESYRTAAEAARLMGRVALIETSSEHAKAWADLIPDKPALVIMPRVGAHPVMPARSELN